MEKQEMDSASRTTTPVLLIRRWATIATIATAPKAQGSRKQLSTKPTTCITDKVRLWCRSSRAEQSREETVPSLTNPVPLGANPYLYPSAYMPHHPRQSLQGAQPQPHGFTVQHAIREERTALHPRPAHHGRVLVVCLRLPGLHI